MLLDPSAINDGLFDSTDGEPAKATKAMNPLDRAAMMKAMAMAKGKDWSKQATDTGDNYYGVGSETTPSKKNWEPITSDDIGTLFNLGIKL